MKTKQVYIMALVVIVVAVAIGIICLYSTDTKEVLEGTLVHNNSGMTL